MSLEVTGKICAVYPAVQVSEKFKKREFVIEIAETISGNVYTNFGKFQLVQTKCDIVDRFRTGDMVKVSFNVKGTSYEDKNNGQTKYITNLDAWRVEAANQPAQQQQQQYAPPPAYGGAPQQYASSSPAAPQYQPPQYNNEVIDDLPF
jgi:DNA segregation ATPase FtsK/SpoIIIE-like protein